MSKKPGRSTRPRAAPAARSRAEDGREDDDERSGGPRDLDPGASQERRSPRAGHDGRVDAVLGRDARGDRQGHRQRERDHADHRTRHEVGDQMLPLIALLEGLPERGRGGDLELGAEERLGCLVAPLHCSTAGTCLRPQRCTVKPEITV